MNNLIKFGNAFQYGIAEFICDEEADVKKLPVSDTPGSRALVIASGNVYYLNSKRQWIKCGGTAPTEEFGGTEKK